MVWGIAGMLHDADYENWPEDHPRRIVAWLRERGEEEIAYAISGHYTKWGVPLRSPLDRALLACDELTGFIVACCLVRPEGMAACGQTPRMGIRLPKRWGTPSSGRMRGAFPTGWRPESLARSVPPSFAEREGPPRTPPRRRFAPRRRARDFLHSLVATLGARSVKKKLRDEAFAASVERSACRAGAELLGWTSANTSSSSSAPSAPTPPNSGSPAAASLPNPRREPRIRAAGSRENRHTGTVLMLPGNPGSRICEPDRMTGACVGKSFGGEGGPKTARPGR